jgi:hypothetical protein
MWLSLLPIFVALSTGQACHPECSYQCDDPVCPAACSPVCLPPVCSRCLNHSGVLEDCVATDQCYTRCPADQCEAEQCPACETLCPTGICRDAPDCVIQCEATQCGWRCTLPLDCPLPVCVLQCEAPACAEPSAATAPVHKYDMLYLALASAILILQ